ncbi:hypothetical protein BEL04_01850 [Mucilaginibacter sp. PPCGB 2223]|uniref:alpha-2-macroglobulin family protein n=1 Tax=Mucilaginibacter sp. PPCGB 2223 TaxID=1886027 RepID=UPI0008248567|nr:alpha-2-macroglobulin family protein [Mucilaginibacter sp. PPCGB 2223]OCX53085.1 hypothetical protein BEL04_01850 [Mucilaginibacter sp. PPCGB 2223]
MHNCRVLKNATLVIALLCAGIAARGQDYLRINYRIDSLLQLGLPKSAMEQVDKLDELARVNKNVPQQINAAIYRMTFQTYIEENALVAIITRLKLDVAKAGYPVKPVLQSILASMYYNYYQQNRWKFASRSRLEKASVDFRNWDLQTIINETGATYMASLADTQREQVTPIDVLDGVLKGDQSTRVLRPTLYDFLLHRALDFFLSDEPALTRPKLAFSVNDPGFFGDSQTFAGLPVVTADTASTFYRGIKYLQQATLFHLKKHNAAALGDLDIRRLAFLYSKATLLGKDSLYVRALRSVAKQFAADPISADAWVTIGRYFQQKDSLKTSLAYFRKAHSDYPESFGGKNADVLIKQVAQKALSANIENINIPNSPILALINYRNVQKIKFTVYKLSEAQQKQFDDEEHGYLARYRSPELANWLPGFLKDKTIASQQFFQLPDPQDYRQHRSEINAGSLKSGNYLAFIENAEETDSLLMCFVSFNVSGLSFAARDCPDNTTEVRVMDRETGEPLKGVRIDIKMNGDNYYSYQTNVHGSGKTDSKGMFKIEGATSGRLNFDLSFNGDTLSNQSRYVYRNNDSDDDDPKNRTILFTDRQIYRPGQIIYFKALQLLAYRKKTLIDPGKEVTVDLRDVNGKAINSLTLKTNEYGTVAGSFALPQSMLTGQVTIETDDGEIEVRVEEYKRPTFEVAFLPVKESYRLNDSVKVKGQVTAFSGYGLSQPVVAYHITRRQQWTSYRYGYNNPEVEIKTDTIKADDKGQFEIKFKALPADSADLKGLVYNYAINADVTDASGETHSANASVNVGNNNILINTYLPAEVLSKDTGKVFAGINNLNGQAIKGSLNIRVYALQNPEQLYKNRLWQAPDQQSMTEGNFRAAFPDYTYRNEDDQRAWKRLKKISDTTFTVDNVRKAYFNLNALRKQTSAVYLVAISAQNEKGDTVSADRYVSLLADKPRASKLTQWVVPVYTIVKPGGFADFLVGNNQHCRVLMEKFEGPKLLLSKWLDIGSGGQQHVRVPVNMQDSDISVQFLMVYHNRMYQTSEKIYVQKPGKDLDIKMLTFHNKLQPGQKDEWKLRITNMAGEKQSAELVAGLYDASLDALAPAKSWQDILYQYQYRYSNNRTNWQTYDFVSQHSTAPLLYKYYRYQTSARIYEYLDMYGYNYYGDYNYAYRAYLDKHTSSISTRKLDDEMNAQYLRNSALIKNGVDITGKVTGAEDGDPIAGVAVKIKGTNIFVITNTLGYFKIKVPLNDVLVFSFIGYITKEVAVTKNESLSVVLKESSQALSEVAVVGYGSVAKKDVTASVSTVSSVRINGKDFAGASAKNALEGKLAGVEIINGTPGDAAQILIRGASSLGSVNAPLYVIDGVIADHLDIDAGDISSINILKVSEATAIYGSRGSNGVVVINTKKGAAALANSSKPIAIRKNFNETAFFYPQLHTGENGEILLDFTMPEALTSWKFKAFAHTKDLKNGYYETQIVTQKQLSITANTPRFLREGDTITISARIANLTTTALKGKVNLQLFNGVNMQPISLLLNATDAHQDFDITASATKAVSFRMVIPSGLDALTYRLTADAGLFTDGEENTVPVLPNRMLVTEAMPMMVRPGEHRAYTFDKLLNQHSSTLKNKTLTLEYTQNPAWYAVQALPYMMEFPYECSEQLFSRYYANSLGTSLVNKLPVIKRVFDQWKATNSSELLSNLEKNQELKATLLEETPWLRDAQSETEQKKRIALLFDVNKMGYELQQNLDKLQQRQLSDGGFPWFGGDRADRYITVHILEGIGQLYHLAVADAKNTQLMNIADKAMQYLNSRLIADANWEKAHHEYDSRLVSSTEIYSYYTKSYFPAEAATAEMKELQANYLQHAERQWLHLGVYEQGLIALTMLRDGKPEVAKAIIHSLTENAQQSDELGMYWAKNRLGWFWYESPIETQSMLIELFTEAGNQDKAVAEMKIWLLRNKQTNSWKTTKATAAAVYALLLKSEDWLAEQTPAEIKLGGANLQSLKPDIKTDAGTGYIKTAWADEQITRDMAKVEIKNNSKLINWGAVYWQYLENLDKITPSTTDIALERRYFVVKHTDAGEILTAIDATHQPKVGDLLKVVVYLKAGRDYEYVQLKDMRPSGTEPIDVLSGYKYQDGLWYYQVTKDAATNFFIDRLNKGNYVFEYRLRVAQPGNFSTGITSVQSMYAPEFNAHSEGARMLVR